MFDPVFFYLVNQGQTFTYEKYLICTPLHTHVKQELCFRNQMVLSWMMSPYYR
jgi:hypothetical protein